MADFKLAVQKTLIHEGGYVNISADSGGATNMGIEQRDLPNVPIKELTVNQAIAYYQANFWSVFYSQIEDQTFADKLFDMGVLFGFHEVVYILQVILGIPADKNFGPVTLTKVNSVEPGSLLSAFQSGLVTHALGVCNANPKDRVFLVGWIRRINS